MAKKSLFEKAASAVKNAVSSVQDVATGKATDENHGVTAMLERYWNTAFSARSELDWKWFQYDLWYNGNHYARWDKNTQQIITVNPLMDGRPKVTINKVYSTLRGIRSYVLKSDPIAEVTPTNMTDQNVDQAMYLNRLLFYLHDHLHLRASLRASMLHALKYSVGWWQVLWDEQAEEGKGGIVVNVVDPYDLYVDPVARIPAEARYMILAVRRNIDDLRQDPKYKDADWDSIVGADTLAASPLKSRILMYERGQYSFNDGEKQHGSVIVREYWYKSNSEVEDEIEDEENPGKMVKVKKQKPTIMICAMVNNQIIRKPEDTGLNRLPFFRLASDIQPLEMYGQGWCKNLIPLNRMLEQNESSIMEYNVVVNKGRYSVDKNAGISKVTNQHGIFVEHKVGHEVVPLEIPQLSTEAQNQIVRINQYIEDIGCQHDASKGLGTPNATSGVAIEALQEGDDNNLSELIENTEEFLQDVYEYILFLLSTKLVLTRNVITATQTGEKMFFKIIGEEAEDDLKGKNKDDDQQPIAPQQGSPVREPGKPVVGGTIIVPKACEVRVSIASYLAYTADGRRQAMKDLASFPQMQNLPPDVILKAYNVGPIADIVKSMLDEEKRQAAQQAQMQQQEAGQQTQQKMQLAQQQNQQKQQQAQQNAQIQQQQQERQAALQQQQQQANQPANMGVHQAIAFIKELISALDHNTQLPPLPNQITPTFIAYLQHFEQSPEAQANPDVVQVLEMVRNRAILQMEGGGQQAQAAQ